MVRKLLLAVIIWMVSASPVWAENWRKLGTAEIADYYLDLDSVRKASGYVYAWYLMNYVEPDRWGDLSAKAYSKIDCDSLGKKDLKIEFYDSHWAQGKRTGASTPTGEWVNFKSPAPPRNKIFLTACKMAK